MFKVGVKSLLNLTVVILEVIASSVSSINLVNAECLNALSKFVRLFVLKFVTVVRTFDSRVSFALTVFFELYVNVIPSLNFVYSGSIIVGVTDAILYVLLNH